MPDSSFDTLRYGLEGQVAVITLARPERRNAMGSQLKRELVAAFGLANDDPAVRVIVLTGEGPAFCAGGDVKEMQAAQAAGESRSLEEKIRPSRDATLLAIHESVKPVIAAVNGAAAGAGMNLALAADIRLASNTARFSQAFVRRGLPPDTGATYFLPRIVGMAKACELALIGDAIDADEAMRLGIVSRVLEPEALMPAALDMAQRIAAGPPIAIRLARQALHQGMRGTLREALAREAAALNVCLDTDDAKEGVRAFLEKREPRFMGS